jgi:hypothetical protein
VCPFKLVAKEDQCRNQCEKEMVDKRDWKFHLIVALKEKDFESDRRIDCTTMLPKAYFQTISRSSGGKRKRGECTSFW